MSSVNVTFSVSASLDEGPKVQRTNDFNQSLLIESFKLVPRPSSRYPSPTQGFNFCFKSVQIGY